MKIDYVRVYQRKGQTNTGCNPKDYPTADYIKNHLQAYTGAFCVSFFFVIFLGTDGGCTLDVNMTTWQWEKPKNSLVSGSLLLWPLGCIDSVRFFVIVV